jgi:hypothetical protein
VLPQAWSLASAERARQLLVEPDNPDCRPFLGWLSWSVDPELRLYLSRGMVLHGLPDVAAPLDPEDRWSLARAREAVLFACQQMVWSNEPFAAGTVLEVPVGSRIGPHAMEHVEGDVERYRTVAVEPGPSSLEVEIRTGITLNPSSVKLELDGDPDGVRARWRKAAPGTGPHVAFNTYRELFLLAVGERLSVSYETQLTPEPEPGGPPFEVDVLAADDGSGFFLVTNGLGRVPQPGGESESGTAHIEIVAAMTEHHPLIASMLATVGGQVHLHEGGGDTYKAGDTVGMEVPEIDAAGFVLRDAGHVDIARGGPLVHLVELVPLSAAEYGRVRSYGSGPWLTELEDMSPQARSARWRLRFH